MDEFLSDHARSVLLPNRRCTATATSTGERCGRASALGQFVCDRHGGKAPLSIQAAKERMAILVEPAMEVLYRATRSAPPCEHCGRSDADRDPTAVRAAQIILDRTGHHPTLQVQVQPSPDQEDWSSLTLAQLADRAEEMARQCREMADEEAARMLPGAGEAKLLDAYEVPEADDIRPTPPEELAKESPSD